MAETEFERAMAYSNAALGYLQRGEVPAYPQFYELFYTYATGSNSALNERINELFLNEESISFVESAEALYNEFMRSKSVDERMAQVSSKISSNIDAVHDAITDATKNAETYSGSLSHAEDLFSHDLDPKKMQEAVRVLLTQTQSMRDSNKLLESKLEDSRSDINMLQKDLELVQRETMTDALTKISNRKCFDSELERALTESKETNQPLTLAMIDIDHFKKFNDTYGHQVGDQVLRLVAMTLRAHTKGKDLAARYGGEEFALILPDTDIHGAQMLAEKIRAAIEGKQLTRKSTNEKLGRVTASFGLATYRSEDSVSSLIERADKAMYSAKDNGRNQVVSEFDKVAQLASKSAA